MNESCHKFFSADKEYLSAIGINAERGVLCGEYRLHTHDFSEVFIIVSGTATHMVNEWEYPLSRGDVFAIKGNTAHGFRDMQDLDIINLMYMPDFFLRSYSEIHTIPGFDPFFLIEPDIRSRRSHAPSLKLNDEALRYVTVLTDFLCEQQARHSPSLYPVLKMNFAALVSYISTQYTANCSANSQISVLSRALAYMEAHLAEPVRLADISAQVFLSPRQLERLFREYYGESPMLYLKKMRLNNALALLVRQRECVADAARKTGFQDISYFIRTFRESFGVTPGTARKHFSDIPVPDILSGR